VTPACEPEEATVVLVIDDCTDIQRLLAAKLASAGYEVRTASSGSEGLESARADPPSLILLDLLMPGIDGFETLRELKEHPTLMHTPVIVLSGCNDTADKVAGLELGAVDYISKPFDAAELRARVRSALRLHRLMRLLAQRAQIDGLTGLWNRTYFDERLISELGAHRRSGEPLTLAIGDLDLFKKINDDFGHPAGDAVLEGFARIITSELRAGDEACRYGGEEFALLFRSAGETEAMAALERIRERLQETVWPNHPDRRVTASFGLAGAGPRRETADKLVAAADAALYAAKQAGRNRVVAAEDEPRRRLAS
jgi:diguanylate cyclase (GGDEF)-like protein